MPSLLRHTECPACGHRHHFCFIGDDLTPGRDYEYICPETAKKATLRPTSAVEVVRSTPQGAVALTAKVHNSLDSLGHSSSGAVFEPAHGQAVASESLAEAACGRTGPSSPAAAAAPRLPGIEREVHEIERQVRGLAARVGELEEKVNAPPPGVTPPPRASEPEAGPTRLQEVLPEVKDLAGKIGGLKKLSAIIETLKETRE